MTQPRNALGQFTSAGGGGGANQQLTVSIVTNPQGAQQTQQTLEKHDQTIRQIMRSYRDWEMAARKMTAVGRDLAIGGAAILAPLIASANEYSKRFGQLETQSRNFLAAQQRQADATANLGRVAAQTLTPFMNQVADFTNKVAAFAAAHPELMQAAVGLGAGLAAGGGALVAAGMAISTLAKSAELLKAALAATGTSGLAGAVGAASVSILALAVGAEIGKRAINAYGDSVNDQRLKNYQFSDALTTARQAFAAISLTLFKTLGDVGKGLADAWTDFSKHLFDFGTKVEDVSDRLATSFRELFIKLQGYFGDLYNQTIGKVNGNTLPGSDSTLVAVNAEENAYEQRQSARDEANKYGRQALDTTNSIIHVSIDAALKVLADSFAKFGQTGAFGGGVDSFLGGIGKSVGSFFSGIPQTSGESGSGLPPEAVNAYIDYRKSLLRADQQYETDSKALTDNYNATNLKAQQDYQAQQQRDSLKALQQFNFNEKQIEQKAHLDRLLALQQHLLKLDQLSGARDVEGFINEQATFQLQQSAQDKQDALAKQQRLDQFNETQKEQKDQQAAQFKQEQADRATAYRQQLTQLQQKHAQEDFLLLQHYSQQLADLSQNLGGLNTLQSQYYADMTTAAANFVKNNRSLLQQAYSSTYNGTAPSGNSIAVNAPGLPPPGFMRGANGSIVPIGSASSGVSLPGSGRTIGSFASGIDRIPRDMLIIAHQDERIVRAVDNTPGASRPIQNIYVYNNVGDIATKSMLDQYTQDIALGIRRAIAS